MLKRTHVQRHLHIEGGWGEDDQNSGELWHPAQPLLLFRENWQHWGSFGSLTNFHSWCFPFIIMSYSTIFSSSPKHSIKSDDWLWPQTCLPRVDSIGGRRFISPLVCPVNGYCPYIQRCCHPISKLCTQSTGKVIVPQQRRRRLSFSSKVEPICIGLVGILISFADALNATGILNVGIKNVGIMNIGISNFSRLRRRYI